MYNMQKLQDEVAVEKTVVIEDYRAIQMKSFQYLQTTPSMWQMCEITGKNEDGTLSFAIPIGYEIVTAFSNLIDKNRAEALHLLFLAGQDVAICELCGHDIKYPFPIKCDNV